MVESKRFRASGSDPSSFWTSFGYYLTVPQRAFYTVVLVVVALLVLVLLDTLVGALALLVGIYFVWNRDQSLNEWEKRVLVTIVATVLYFSLVKVFLALVLSLAYVIVLILVWRTDVLRGFRSGGVRGAFRRVLGGRARPRTATGRRRAARFMARTLTFHAVVPLVLLLVTSGTAAAREVDASGREVIPCNNIFDWIGGVIGSGFRKTCQSASAEVQQAVAGDFGTNKDYYGAGLVKCQATGTMLDSDTCREVTRAQQSTATTPPKVTTTNAPPQAPPLAPTRNPLGKLAEMVTSLVDVKKVLQTNPETGTKTFSAIKVLSNGENYFTRDDIGGTSGGPTGCEPGATTRPTTGCLIQQQDRIQNVVGVSTKLLTAPSTPAGVLRFEPVVTSVPFVATALGERRDETSSAIVIDYGPTLHAPAVDLSVLETTAGLVRLKVIGEDDDGDLRTLGVVLKAKASGPTLHAVTRNVEGEEASFEYNVRNVAPGNYLVLVTATDALNKAAGQEFTVTMPAGATEASDSDSFDGGDRHTETNDGMAMALKIESYGLNPSRGVAGQTYFEYTVVASHNDATPERAIRIVLQYGDGVEYTTYVQNHEQVKATHRYAGSNVTRDYATRVTATYESLTATATLPAVVDGNATTSDKPADGDKGENVLKKGFEDTQASGSNYLPYILWGLVLLVALGGGFLYARQQGWLTERFGILPKDTSAAPDFPGAGGGKKSFLKRLFRRKETAQDAGQAWAERFGLQQGPPKVEFHIAGPLGERPAPADYDLDAPSPFDPPGPNRGGAARGRQRRKRGGKK